MEINELLDIITSTIPKKGFVEIDSIFEPIYVKEELTKEELKIVAKNICLKDDNFSLLTKDKYGYEWNFYKNERDFYYFNAMYAVLIQSEFITEYFSERFNWGIIFGLNGDFEELKKTQEFIDIFNDANFFMINYDNIPGVKKNDFVEEIDTQKIIDFLAEFTGPIAVQHLKDVTKEWLQEQFGSSYDLSNMFVLVDDNFRFVADLFGYCFYKGINFSDIISLDNGQLANFCKDYAKQFALMTDNEREIIFAQTIFFFSKLMSDYKGKGLH